MPVNKNKNKDLPEEKTLHISEMFNRISRRYDFLNRLLSLRQDVRWRNRMAHYLPKGNDLRVLDVASGTGDVPIALAKKSKVLRFVIGIDRAEDMLALGREKIARQNQRLKWVLFPADAEELPFRAESFDAVTMAFGIRNVSNREQTLQEMARVVRSGGRVIILEFSLPTNPLFRIPYLFYFRHLLPVIGGRLSGNRNAYRYLNRSVEDFPAGRVFGKMLTRAGWQKVQWKPLSFGIVTIYWGEKM